MFSLTAAVIIHKQVEPGLCPAEFRLDLGPYYL